MNLDLLRTEWAARDERLEKTLRLNTRLLHETLVERHREEIHRIGPFGKLELVLWIPSLALLGLFMAHHAHDLRFFIPAALLLAWCIVLPAISIRQREALRNLDYSEPVVSIQKRLEALKIGRLRVLKWAFLVGQVLWWVPFVTVLLKGVVGVNLYALPYFPTFAFYNIAGGVLFIPLAIAASHFLAGRLAHSPRFQRFTDMLAGRDIEAARAFLGKLSRFEQE